MYIAMHINSYVEIIYIPNLLLNALQLVATLIKHIPET